MANVTYERDGATGVVTLVDPPLNLLTNTTIDGLASALEEAEKAPPRALLLRAEGENFSAGVDVGDVFRDRSADEARSMLTRFTDLSARFERLPFPTIAAVQGLCLAGGFELVLGCDMAWAADDAKLGLIEAAIGAIPFAGGTQRIAERAGVARAAEVAFAARVYDAATLERWNVVNRVVPAADLADKSLAFAKRLASGPTRAHAATKRLLRTYRETGLAASDRMLPEVAAPLFETQDMQKAIVSLLESGPGNATFEGE